MNTIYFLNTMAGNVFKSQTTPALPNNFYLGLSTTAPSSDGTNVTEPDTANGYSRVQLSSLGAPIGAIVKNTADIDFPESTGSWGIVTHYVIYDSSISGTGNLLMYGALPVPRSVEAFTIMTVKQDKLTLSVQNEV